MEPPREDTCSTGMSVQPVLEAGACDGPNGHVLNPESPGHAQSEDFQAAEVTVPLTLTIVGTRGLWNKDRGLDSGRSCYCLLRTLKDQHLHTTASIDGALDPLWNEEVEVDFAPGETLEFSIWEQALASDGSIKSDQLGRAVLESNEYASLGFNGEARVQDTVTGIEAYLQVKVKSAGQEYPHGPPRQVVINLEKLVGKPMGLNIDISSGKMCYVCFVMEDGVFAEYNRTATPEKQLRPGDYITKVNGIEGNSFGMLECLNRDNRLEVTIQRPILFTVAISRHDAKTSLGLTLVEKPSGYSAFIMKVLKGLVMEYNIMHPEQELRAGDRIVAVNGKRGSVAELIRASEVGTQLQLAISRPCTRRA